jgi:hypothetical protein
MALGDLFEGADRIIGPNSGRNVQYVQMGSDKSDDRPLLEEYTELRGRIYSRYLQSMIDDDKFYRLEFGADLIPKEWREKGFDATIPPTAYNAVEAASNHILTTPDILVPERPTEENVLREQMIAAQKASALGFFWHQTFKEGDPLGHAKKDLIKYGKIVLKKTIYWEELDPKGAYTGKRRFPWCVTQLNPSSVFEVGPAHDPIAVYEAYMITRVEAERLFPEATGIWRKKDSLEDVRVLEYWEKPRQSSKGRRVVWIEDERVLNKANPYHAVVGYKDNGSEIYGGYVPYFIADSGWGDGDIAAEPHERYVGMIRRIHSLMLTEARQISTADAQLRIATFPITVLENIEEDDEKPLVLGPGAKVYTNDTQKIYHVDWPKLDPATFALTKSVHTYANELAQFQSLSGIPQSGVDSATEADQNYRSASSKLAGPLAALKSIITRINETVLWDIENIFESGVTVYGAVDGAPGVITITPEMIDGFYENYVELKTSDQKALDAAHALQWANLGQVMGLDARFVMRMAGIPNPQQRLAQKWEEDLWKDPRSHELRMAQYMAQQGGAFGAQLSDYTLKQMLAGVPVDPEAPAGGEFAGGGMGAATAREEAPAMDSPAQGEAYQNNGARAAGFGKAMADRPDLMYGAA